MTAAAVRGEARRSRLVSLLLSGARAPQSVCNSRPYLMHESALPRYNLAFSFLFVGRFCYKVIFSGI